MQHINYRNTFLIVMVFLLSAPLAFAQTMGNRADLVNKTWRIVGMKCPASMNTDDSDQFVHYYGSLTLTPDNYNSINYGTFVQINRDMSDNPIQKGTYSLVTDEMNGTRLVLKPKRGNEVTYRVELVYANHLTLINLGDDAKCKVSYAIAP